MATTNVPVGELWNHVRQLPAGERLSLATRILRSLEQDAGDERPTKKTLADLVGIMATDEPPPTDAEVDQILEEEREGRFR